MSRASDARSTLTVQYRRRALQRARTVLETARVTAGEVRSPGSAMNPDARLLKRYVDVLGRPDATAAVELVRAYLDRARVVMDETTRPKTGRELSR